MCGRTTINPEPLQVLLQCIECPRHQGLIDYLNDELSEEITYKQWVSTDRAELTIIVESKEKFVQNLATQVDKLMCHSFTAKAQSSYMKTLKASMTPEELLLQGDLLKISHMLYKMKFRASVGKISKLHCPVL